MNVVIAGGGSVGRFIAEQLVGGGHSVVVIESEARVVTQYESTIEGVTWLKGDGCDFGTLKAAGLERADVVASVTGSERPSRTPRFASRVAWAELAAAWASRSALDAASAAP